jgi:hypothetical protein
MEDNCYVLHIIYPASSKTTYRSSFTYDLKNNMRSTGLHTHFITMVEAMAAVKLIFEIQPDVVSVEVYNGIELVKTIKKPKSEIIEVK